MNPTINLFELRFSTGRSNEYQDGIQTIYSQLWIDGHHLDEPHFIDLPQLLKSLYEPGMYEIFTCGCGVAACAGIVEGIKVTYDDSFIRWEMKRPISAGNLYDETYDTWEKIAVPVSYMFKKSQMRSAIKVYLKNLRFLAKHKSEPFNWPVHGLNFSEVLKIDPDEPFYLDYIHY